MPLMYPETLRVRPATPPPDAEIELRIKSEQ